MATFEQVILRIKYDLQLRNAPTTLEEYVKLAVVEAVELLSQEQLWFTIADASFTLTSGVKEYLTGGGKVPADFLGPISEHVWLLVNGEESNQIQLTRLDANSYEAAEASYGTANTYPQGYMWEMGGFHVVPAPDVSTHQVRFRYHKDIPKPTATVTAGAWVFSADSFESDWFDDERGGQATRALAKRILQESGPMTNDAGAARAGVAYQDAIKKIRAMAEARDNGSRTTWRAS